MAPSNLLQKFQARIFLESNSKKWKWCFNWYFRLSLRYKTKKGNKLFS